MILRIQPLPFGFHFLIPAPDCMPPPPRLCPHLCRWSEFGPRLSGTTVAAFRRVHEIALGLAATDAPSILPRIVAAILLGKHPGKPNALPLLQSAPGSPAARKRLPLMPPPAAKTPAQPAIRAMPPFPLCGTRVLPTLEKSARSSF